jgi:hypothetical protein
MAFHYLDLLGAPFFRRFAEFRSNRIRIDQFLSQALLGECERRNKGEVNGSHAYLPSKKSRAHIEAFRHDTGQANHDLQFSASSRAGFKVLAQPPYDDCELAHKGDDLHSTNALPDLRNPVTGLSCHVAQKIAQLDAGVGPSGPHGFAVRVSTIRRRESAPDESGASGTLRPSRRRHRSVTSSVVIAGRTLSNLLLARAGIVPHHRGLSHGFEVLGGAPRRAGGVCVRPFRCHVLAGGSRLGTRRWLVCGS